MSYFIEVVSARHSGERMFAGVIDDVLLEPGAWCDGVDRGVPVSELDAYLPRQTKAGKNATVRVVSGRNQLVGRVEGI
jgi:hypothetical protein